MNKITQKASLIGQVVEDLTYEALSLQRFEVKLLETGKAPQYKNGGYFVFSDLSPGDYTLRISGERFQPLRYPVTIPLAIAALGSPPSYTLYPLFDPQSENELAVIVKGLNGGGGRITIEEVTLKKEIRAGSPVLASGVFTTLAETLEVGKITQAKVGSLAGIAPGAIVRIIRDRSIRVKFDPYYLFPEKLTSIAGKVVSKNPPGMPLEGVKIRLAKVGGNNVAFDDTTGAKIATVGAGTSAIVLGAEKDVVTLTNQQGDYSLYFEKGKLTGVVTLEATITGYQTLTRPIAITELARNRADFELARS